MSMMAIASSSFPFIWAPLTLGWKNEFVLVTLIRLATLCQLWSALAVSANREEEQLLLSLISDNSVYTARSIVFVYILVVVVFNNFFFPYSDFVFSHYNFPNSLVATRSECYH